MQVLSTGSSKSWEGAHEYHLRYFSSKSLLSRCPETDVMHMSASLPWEEVVAIQLDYFCPKNGPNIAPETSPKEYRLQHQEGQSREIMGLGAR